MDLRSINTGLPPEERCAQRRRMMEEELGIDLSAMRCDPKTIGHAEEKNCEQMFGHIPMPVGYAGPLIFTFSSGEKGTIHLPLATTEGALVASVNRGCKVLSQCEVVTTSVHHGVSRSMAFRVKAKKIRAFVTQIDQTHEQWKQAAEATSNHLKLLHYSLDECEEYVFLTIYCDTDEAMGMNMVTIAAQAIGQWIMETLKEHEPAFITVAANVDSDKKPSKRTHESGRGYEVTVSTDIPSEAITTMLKATSEAMLSAADAKLRAGSHVAGAIGHNLHAANIIAALYLATGQDAAHVVEGSLADTAVSWFDPSTSSGQAAHHDTVGITKMSSRAESRENILGISVRIPALLVGVRGGGTTLPAQSQCLAMLLKPETSLHPCRQLAESIGAAVLAGEISLLAAQASHTLASSHKSLAR